VCLLLQVSFVPSVVGFSAVLAGVSTVQYRMRETAGIKKITGKEKWQ
jgi:hypothetical protein